MANDLPYVTPALKFATPARELLFLSLYIMNELIHWEDRMRPFIRLKICLILLSGLNISTLISQVVLEDRMYYAYDKSMQYFLYIPENYDPGSKYPLVIPFGSPNYEIAKNTIWCTEEIQSEYPSFILFPVVPQGYLCYEYFDILHSLLCLLFIEYPVDITRLYVIGGSQYGIATWDFATFSPFHIAAAIPAMAEGYPQSIALVKPLPAIWIWHGEKDMEIPVESARIMVAAIEDIGIEVVYTDLKDGELTGLTDQELDSLIESGAMYLYTELKDRGHGIMTDLRENKLVPKWLFQQKTDDYSYDIPAPPEKEITALPDFIYIGNKAVLTCGSEGSWDEGNVGCPVVIIEGDTLCMWYIGWPSIWSDTSHVGYALSVDGQNWDKYPGNPVFQAELAWEGTSIYDLTVIKDEGLYKMWYGADYKLIGGSKIGYATSIDGINWQRNSEPVLLPGTSSDWDYNTISPASVIKEDGQYKMYFHGGNWFGNYQIGLAISQDGIHWQKYDDPTTSEELYAKSDPVLQIGTLEHWDFDRVWHPNVLLTENGYEMYYTGSNIGENLLCYAISDDGIHWFKNKQNPVLKEIPSWFDPYHPPFTLRAIPNFFGGTVISSEHLRHYWFTLGWWDLNIGYAVDYGQIARGDSIRCDKRYYIPGSDIAYLKAWIKNPNEHNIRVLAQMNDFNHTIIDSLELFDDGNHNDFAPGDNIWGNTYDISSEEQTYRIMIKTIDLDLDYTHLSEKSYCPDYFTTIGPVGYTGCIEGSYSPRYRTKYFNILLTNYGTTTTASNVSAVISTKDTCVEQINHNKIYFPEIAPGETVQGIGEYSFNYTSGCAGVKNVCDIPFDLTISINQISFWEYDSVTSVRRTGSGSICNYRLDQNYPNPFNPITKIAYSIRQPGRTKLVLYDILGRVVKVMVDKRQTPGSYEVKFDGRDLASGVYFYRLQSGPFTKIRKMVLIK